MRKILILLLFQVGLLAAAQTVSGHFPIETVEKQPVLSIRVTAAVSGALPWPAYVITSETECHETQSACYFVPDVTREEVYWAVGSSLRAAGLALGYELPGMLQMWEVYPGVRGTPVTTIHFHALDNGTYFTVQQ